MYFYLKDMGLMKRTPQWIQDNVCSFARFTSMFIPKLGQSLNRMLDRWTAILELRLKYCW